VISQRALNSCNKCSAIIEDSLVSGERGKREDLVASPQQDHPSPWILKDVAIPVSQLRMGFAKMERLGL